MKQTNKSQKAGVSKLFRPRAVIIAAIGLFLTVAIFGVTRGRMSPVITNQLPGTVSNHVAGNNVAVNHSASWQDGLRFQLGGNGFTPAQATHSPGSFEIAVLNNGVGDNYTLRLTAQDGTVINEKHVQKGSVAWNVNLAAGQYTLTVVDREWSSVINVH